MEVPPMRSIESEVVTGGSRDLQELVEEALRRPGVKELMAVYGKWESVDEATRAHRQVMGVKRVVSASDHTQPTVTR
jgi:hypothetical protein